MTNCTLYLTFCHLSDAFFQTDLQARHKFRVLDKITILVIMQTLHTIRQIIFFIYDVLTCECLISSIIVN